MIAPKTAKPTAREEQEAYEACTIRDLNTCVRCGRHEGIQRDHRRNRQPGNTVISNLQCLCLWCHDEKTNHPKDAVRGGFAVPSSIHNPAEYPARRLINGVFRWVLYGDWIGYEVLTDARAAAISTELGVQ